MYVIDNVVVKRVFSFMLALVLIFNVFTGSVIKSYAIDSTYTENLIQKIMATVAVGAGVISNSKESLRNIGQDIYNRLSQSSRMEVNNLAKSGANTININDALYGEVRSILQSQYGLAEGQTVGNKELDFFVWNGFPVAISASSSAWSQGLPPTEYMSLCSPNLIMQISYPGATFRIETPKVSGTTHYLKVYTPYDSSVAFFSKIATTYGSPVCAYLYYANSSIYFQIYTANANRLENDGIQIASSVVPMVTNATWLLGQEFGDPDWAMNNTATGTRDVAIPGTIGDITGKTAQDIIESNYTTVNNTYTGTGAFDIPALLTGVTTMITSLFVPTAGYFDLKFGEIKLALGEKFNSDEVERLSGITSGATAFPDVYFKNKIIMSGRFVREQVDVFRGWIQGIIAFGLVCYNVDMLYFMVRGTHIMSASGWRDRRES